MKQRSSGWTWVTCATCLAASLAACEGNGSAPSAPSCTDACSGDGGGSSSSGGSPLHDSGGSSSSSGGSLLHDGGGSSSSSGGSPTDGGGDAMSPAEAAIGDASGSCDAGCTADSSADASAPVDSGNEAGDATATQDAPTGPQDAAAPDSATTHDTGSETDSAAVYRDPLAQPFASTSIWNMPIGSSASYVAASIVTPTASTLQGDQDIIVLTPTAPQTPIYENSAAWQSTVSRCPYDVGPLFYDVPVPSDFVVGDTPISDTPNNSFAALLADNRTLKQNQPFTRCTAGDPATTYNTFPDVDLYGDGVTGAHGGSWLSAIGGTLRVGELRPGVAPPRHALKLELFAHQNYYNDGNQADCYRWPATTCDGYFDDSGSLEYGGTNPALRPGSLLALPASLSIASLGLTTGPAQQLAWTLQNYGAYLVDDSAWSSVSICVENGPAGVFETQFQSDWGFALATNGTTSPFAVDFAKILSNLMVVDNNSATSIGGGGNPLQPLAPPLPPPPGDD